MALPPRTRLFVPNSVTAANIFMGFVSMLAAADGRFQLAVYLLFGAILLDLADGRIARLLHATSKFGQEMDSFSDALSFVAAPAFLVHQAILRDLRGFGVIVCLAYVFAGVFRLARFNLTSDAHAKADHTVGTPTPVAAGYMMALVLMRDRVPDAGAVVLVLIMAMLMISRVQLPELKGRGPVAVAMLVGVANYTAVVLWPNWITVSWWNAWNVVILLVARAESREAELTESSP